MNHPLSIYFRWYTKLYFHQYLNRIDWRKVVLLTQAIFATHSTSHQKKILFTFHNSNDKHIDIPPESIYFLRICMSCETHLNVNFTLLRIFFCYWLFVDIFVDFTSFIQLLHIYWCRTPSFPWKKFFCCLCDSVCSCICWIFLYLF